MNISDHSWQTQLRKLDLNSALIDLSQEKACAIRNIFNAQIGHIERMYELKMEMVTKNYVPCEIIQNVIAHDSFIHGIKKLFWHFYRVESRQFGAVKFLNIIWSPDLSEMFSISKKIYVKYAKQ